MPLATTAMTGLSMAGVGTTSGEVGPLKVGTTTSADGTTTSTSTEVGLTKEVGATGLGKTKIGKTKVGKTKVGKIGVVRTVRSSKAAGARQARMGLLRRARMGLLRRMLESVSSEWPRKGLELHILLVDRLASSLS